MRTLFHAGLYLERQYNASDDELERVWLYGAAAVIAQAYNELMRIH